MTTEKLASDIRKEQIVEAALHILGDNEVKKLKMSEIAARLGLAPSALYRHFRNRDAILSAILEYIRGTIYRNVEEVRQERENAIDRLHELLIRHGRLISRNQGVPRVVFSDELWGQERVKRQRMYRIVNGFLDELEDIVREGQDRGEILRDIEPAAVARMFFGILQPAALLRHMSEGRFDVDAHFEAAWPLFRLLLTGRQGPGGDEAGVSVLSGP
jgi:TetR/AcrR family fatty acid metabolism transcriptional regulator